MGDCVLHVQSGDVIEHKANGRVFYIVGVRQDGQVESQEYGVSAIFTYAPEVFDIYNFRHLPKDKRP